LKDAASPVCVCVCVCVYVCVCVCVCEREREREVEAVVRKPLAPRFPVQGLGFEV
jgi:hypothetical protein